MKKIIFLFLMTLVIFLSIFTVKAEAIYANISQITIESTENVIAIRFSDILINRGVLTNIASNNDLGSLYGNYIIPKGKLEPNEINTLATIGLNQNPNNHIVKVLETYNVVVEEFNRMKVQTDNKVDYKMIIEQPIQLNNRGEPVGGLIVYSKLTRNHPGFIGCFLDKCREIYKEGTLNISDIIASNIRINIAKKEARVGKSGFIGLRIFGEEYCFYEIISESSRIRITYSKEEKTIELHDTPRFNFFVANLETDETYSESKVESLEPKIVIKNNKITFGKFNFSSSKIPRKTFTIKNIFGGSLFVKPFDLIRQEVSYLDENNKPKVCLYHDEEGKAHYNPKALCGIGIGTTEEEIESMSYIYTENIMILQPTTNEEIKDAIG